MVRRAVKPTIFKNVGNGITIYPPFTGKSEVFHSPVLPRRSLLGVLPPPTTPAPAKPVRADLPPPPAGFVRSVHAVPAAYPRQLRESHGTFSRDSHPFRSEPVSPTESPHDKETRLNDETGNMAHKRYDAKEWSLEEARAAQPCKQWISVERWRRETPLGGYTLVCNHASGLQKEHWHTVMRDIITKPSAARGLSFGTGQPLKHNVDAQIDDIWMVDDLHHGVSVDLNAGRLGDVQSWEDTGRDILNFVEHVLPTVAATSPWELEWTANGKGPKVIGVGHSFGGSAMVHAAHARPDLFEALFLVDPMVHPLFVPRYSYYARPVEGYLLSQVALKRRDIWPSSAAARQKLRGSAFFKPWDDEQFDVYMVRGIVPVDSANPDGPVTLATPSWCEAAVFTEPDACARGWDKLPNLDIPIGWLMAGDSVSTRGDEITQEMCWRSPRSRNERIMDSAHLITQENPKALADCLRRFLGSLRDGQWSAPEAAAAKL